VKYCLLIISRIVFMPNRIDPDGIGFLIGDLSRMIRADIDRRIEAAGIGLTPGEARTLAYIARYGQGRQNMLAERMGLEAMTLSSYLDRLERQGFVQRTTDPSDRRAKIVELTHAAEAALETIFRVADEVRLRARGNMNEEEWHLLHEQLKEIRDNFSAD